MALTKQATTVGLFRVSKGLGFHGLSWPLSGAARERDQGGAVVSAELANTDSEQFLCLSV